MSSKPDYVERPTGYDISLAAPYSQKGVRMRVFSVHGDRAKLQATCDRYLNEPGDGSVQYRALGMVLVGFADMERVHAADPNLGSMREIDVAIFVPTIRWDGGMPKGFRLFNPYLFVNNAWAMATGREVLGFRKDIGVSFSDENVDSPTFPGVSALTHVDAWVIPTKTAASRLEKKRVLTLDAAPGVAHDGSFTDLHTAVSSLLGGTVHGVEDLLLDAGLSAATWLAMEMDSLLGDPEVKIPMVFLKQYRDAWDSTKAVVRQVLEADGTTHLSSFRGGGWLPGSHRLTFADFASHPIAAELGVAAGTPIETKLAFEVDFDFDVHHATGKEPEGPRKIAILGGGMGALSAAWEISKRSPKDEITIHSMGWRLGGKCATGRNRAHADRIEEHGIHVFFGFYENAFHLLREVYGDLGLDWKAAFRPHDTFTLEERVGDQWLSWRFQFPRRAGDPGDRLANGIGAAPDVETLAKGVLDWLHGHVGDHFEGHPFFHLVLSPPLWLARRAIHDALRGAADLERVLEHLGTFFSRLWLYVQPVLSAWSWIGFSEWETKLRRFWILAELGGTILAGLVRAKVEEGIHDLTELDDEEFRAWLDRNAIRPGGLSDVTKDSAPLRMLYDVVFAYEDGRSDQPNLAAGTAIRGALRIVLDYEGAIAYEFETGTAEVLFTPLYEALAARGVRFELFHRVDRIEPSADGKRIAKVHLGVQATATSPAGYDPFLDVGGRKCWPSHPLYDRLVQGTALAAGDELEGGGFDLESPQSAWPDVSTEILVEGTDFDEVILAIPVGDQGRICGDLTSLPGPTADRWRAMIDTVRTTPTQHVQLWFDVSTSALGWKDTGDPPEPALLGAFAPAIGNWADFSHLLAHEPWPGPDRPRSLAYLSGPCPVPSTDPYVPKPHLAAGADDAIAWIESNASVLWPAADSFRWELLHAPPTEAGKGRFRSQYYRMNLHPSDRYVLSVAGSTKTRLRADASGFENLRLAGDWTRNGFDAGAVESAVMGGRQAARSLLDVWFPVYGENGSE